MKRLVGMLLWRLGYRRLSVRVYPLSRDVFDDVYTGQEVAKLLGELADLRKELRITNRLYLEAEGRADDYELQLYGRLVTAQPSAASTAEKAS